MMRRLGALLRRRAVILFAAVFGIYLVTYFTVEAPVDRAVGDGTYHPILDRGDGHYMYLMTLSLVLDGDLDLQNQFRLAGDPFGNGRMRTPAGHHWIYPVGTSVLQIPFFLVAQGVAWTANLAGAGLPLHGYTLVHQRITFLGSLLAAFVALVFSYRLARRHVSEAAALAGAIGAGLGTALFFYATYQPSYPHTWTAATCAILLDYWDSTRGRHDARRWAVLGLLVGLCALAREQESVFVIAPAIEGLVEAFRRLRRRDLAGLGRLVGWFGLAAVLALVVASPQLIAKKLIIGRLLEANISTNYMRWGAPFFWETVFSTRNGLFVWTPLAYLGIAGLFFGRRGGARSLGAVAILIFFAEMWVNGSAWSWWADASYANRRFVGCTILVAVGLAFVVERLRGLAERHPRLAPAAALFLLAVPFFAFNLELSWAVRWNAQRTADVVRVPDLYGASFRRILDRIEVAGSPPTWPYSWLWALRFDAPPSLFDTTVGSDRLSMDPDRVLRPGAQERDVVRVSGANFGGAGVGKPGVPDGKLTWAADGARLLFFLHYSDHVTIELRGRVAVPTTVTVNGEARSLAPGPDVVALPLDAPVRVGTNSVAFACAPDSSPGCVDLESVSFLFTR